MCSKNTIILLTNAKNNGSIFSYLAEMSTYLQKNIEEKSSDWVFSQRVSDGEKEAERKIMKMASELHS